VIIGYYSARMRLDPETKRRPKHSISNKRKRCLSASKTSQLINDSKNITAAPGKSFEQSNKRHIHLKAIESLASQLPPFEPAKVIVKGFGSVFAFGVNTHQGVVRSYNEDRVSILLNAQQKYFITYLL